MILLRTFPKTPGYNEVRVFWRDGVMLARAYWLGEATDYRLGKVPSVNVARKIARSVHDFPTGGPLNALDCAFSRWEHGLMEDAR